MGLFDLIEDVVSIPGEIVGTAADIVRVPVRAVKDVVEELAEDVREVLDLDDE